jgi:predicted nucleotidyltransferase
MSYVKRVHKEQLTQVPSYVHGGLQYEVIMGSFAYGVSSDASDTDVYGFCIPNKAIVFPHTTGKYIFGYDSTVHGNFEQWQQHHVIDKSRKKEYDFSIYNITKYFRLCADGNPNMIDSLFVPYRCVTHATAIGTLLREHRFDFLSKKCWHTFKGYAYSQMHKMRIKNPEGKRKQMIEEFGYDVKYAYHLVRLLNEIEQILLEGDLDLERNREQLKEIRRGEWTIEKVEEYFNDKEKYLEEVYATSKEIPNKAQYDKIRELLFTCLEMHFEESIKPETNLVGDFFNDIWEVMNKYERKIKK